jgi:hypothetical protein
VAAITILRADVMLVLPVMAMLRSGTFLAWIINYILVTVSGALTL